MAKELFNNPKVGHDIKILHLLQQLYKNETH